MTRSVGEGDSRSNFCNPKRKRGFARRQGHGGPGPAVPPAQATPSEASRVKAFPSAQRANRSPEEPLARGADARTQRFSVPQGVALGWVNRHPFGADQAEPRVLGNNVSIWKLGETVKHSYIGWGGRMPSRRFER